MARNDIEMRITADAKGVTAGLAPAIKGLDSVQKAAAQTETALADIGGKPITLSVNDQAIENARAEISRLRQGMRETLSTDVTADTSEAQKRIKELQRIVRALDTEDASVEVDVHADTSGLLGIGGALTNLASGVSGAGGLQGGLTGVAGALRGVGTAGAGMAAGVGVGAVAIVGLTQSAADAETQITQLDALTKGMGEETFGELQKWAAETPFAIEDATEATKKLVAAGVPLEEVPDWLNDIGNVASATTGDINQAATIFAQMVSKGRATYEELQQLAETGIPVWKVLADNMGLTVAEVQKMATEGKLGADAIDLARESLAELYPTAMQDQAETFNGQMSTLQDNLSQTGQTLGTLFLPLMTDLVGLLNTAAGWALALSGKLAELDGQFRSFTGGQGIFETLAGAVPGMQGFVAVSDQAGDSVEDTGGKVGDLGSEVDAMAADVVAGMQDSADAAADFEAAVADAERAVQDAISAFAGLGGDVRTKVDFIIDSADLRQEIGEAIKGTEDERAITLPANLRVGQIAGLGDRQQELVTNISGFVEQGLEEGARRASLSPDFDEDAWLTQVRRDTKGMLIDAGINPKSVNRVLNNVFGLPRTVPVEANVSGAQEDLTALTTPIQVPLTPRLAAEADAKGLGLFASLTAGVTAPITPTVGDTDAATTGLANVAMPDGDPRTAKILTQLDALSLESARATLATLTATETKTIKVHLEENPTGEDLTKPGALERLLTPTTITVAGSGGGNGGSPTDPRNVRLAPRQDPIKVYLDGQEIADRLVLRTNKLVRAGSFRRRA